MDCANAPEPTEAGSVALEMFRAYRQMVDAYRGAKGFTDDPDHALTDAEADARARGVGADVVALRERVLTAAPDQVDWWELSRLAEHDPGAAQAGWERVKAVAREELDSGHRAAQAVEVYGRQSPQARARFLVLRRALIEAWQPRHAVEQMLIDTLAQCQEAYEFWLGVMMARASLDAQRERLDVDRRQGWRLPTVTDAQAVEQAAAMVDRFNRLAIRTLRALRDLRRYAPAVTIAQAGQVNIGGQQVNVAGAA